MLYVLYQPVLKANILVFLKKQDLSILKTVDEYVCLREKKKKKVKRSFSSKVMSHNLNMSSSLNLKWSLLG